MDRTREPAVESVTKGARTEMRLTSAVTREGDWYVARCLEVEVTSQGQTLDEALANLKEALELYFEDADAPRPTPPPVIAPVDVEVRP